MMSRASASDLLSKTDLEQRLQMSSKAVNQLIVQLGFPSPVDVVDGRYRWRKEDIEAWIAGKEVQR